MSKRPTDCDEPPAKKRASGRQLTKDDRSEDEEEEERGSIPLAADDVIKGRRVVKARRAGTGAPPPTPTAGVPAFSASTNPFAGVSLLGGTLSTDTSIPLSDSQASAGQSAISQGGDRQPGGEIPPSAAELGAEKPTSSAAATKEDPAPKPQPAADTLADRAAATAGEQPAPAFASFAATAAPFAATAGLGQAFGKTQQPATEGTTGANGATDGFSLSGAGATGSGFSFKPAGGGFPAVQTIFGAGRTGSDANGATEPSGSQADTTKPALASLPPETETVTGEEGEETLWAGDGTLYEFDRAGKWRERGRGELKINRGPGRVARFVLRHRGLLRLLMNANLWPGMTVTPMDGGKGATFPVVNAAASEEGSAPTHKLQTFAFRLKQANSLSGFIDAVNKYKQPPEAAKATTEVK